MDPNHPDPMNWDYGASAPVIGRSPSSFSRRSANDVQYPAASNSLYPMTHNPLSPMPCSSPYPATHAQDHGPRSVAHRRTASGIWLGQEIEQISSPSVAAARHETRPRDAGSPRYAPSTRSATGRASAYPPAAPNPPLTDEYLAKHDTAISRSHSRSVVSSHRSRSHSRAPSQAPTQCSARSRTPAPAHGSALTPHRGSRAAGEHPPVPPLPKHLIPEPTVAIAYGGNKFWVYSESGSKGGGMQVDITNSETVLRFKNGAEHKERKGYGDERKNRDDERKRRDDDDKRYSDDEGHRGHYDDRRKRCGDGRRSGSRERRCCDCGRPCNREEKCPDCERYQCRDCGRYRGRKVRCRDCDRRSERSRSIDRRSGN